MSSMSRSVYLSRLRRAFLLRVHPDRFRTHSAQVRSRQSALVKALSDRMSQDDFVAWQQANDDSSNPFARKKEKKEYSYVLEKRDGSLVRTNIRLNATVDEILVSMAEALKKSGAASLPKPPLEVKVKNVRQRKAPTHTSVDPFTNVDHRYDIVSRRGRDLWKFLQHLNTDEIKDRKASRTDAQAAAQGVRSLFQFQAVDATSLGWSSASVAVLLNRLMGMHEEHSSRFYVDSFYPIRLVFTPDDFHDALDLYGGILRLNPGSTPIQWVDIFRLVTPDRLEEIRQRRNALVEMRKCVQGSLGVKLKKGYSCSSYEFYNFLERLLPSCYLTDEASIQESSLITEPPVAIVEASQACRRPVVTKEGSIRLGANMNEETVRQAVSRLASQAKQKSVRDKEEQQRCKDAVGQIQWELGLQKVYRTGVVSHSQFLDCLSRMLLLEDEKPKMRLKSLAGNSLGIASSGQFCHLSDDGSVVIPHDWR